MIANYLDMRGRRGPLSFILSFVLLSAAGIAVSKGIYAWLHDNHHLSGIIVFLSLLVGLVCTSILLTQAIQRVHDMGKAGIFAIFCIFPAACVPLLYFYPITEIIASPARMALLVLGVIGLFILMLPRRTAISAGH